MSGGNSNDFETVGVRIGAGAGVGIDSGSPTFLIGSGKGALVVFEITGAWMFAALAVRESGAATRAAGCSDAEIAPDSSETSLGGADFPAKNSSASKAGSEERAGG